MMNRRRLLSVIDIRFYYRYSISGKIVYSNGRPINNVTVTLSGLNFIGEEVMQTTKSHDGGLFSFTGLLFGEYSLTSSTGSIVDYSGLVKEE